MIQDLDGWLSPGTARVLVSAIQKDTKVVIEIGSWLGLSALFIAGRAPHAEIYCLDTWQGSQEHQHDPRLASLYASFQHHTSIHGYRIKPIRGDSVAGLGLLSRQGIKPEVIYVDGDHSENGCYRDLATIGELFPKAVIVGDDWTWASVRRAATRYARSKNLAIYVDGNGYTIGPRNISWLWNRLTHILRQTTGLGAK